MQLNSAILFIAAEYIIATFVFGLLYRFVGKKASGGIQRNFGWTGYCIFGSVGVTLHELSHLVTAKIFGHKITDVRLFRPFAGKVDGTLGYVHHSWNPKSLYQKVGNFFIGTAPMFCGAGILFVLLRVGFPNAFTEVAEISDIPYALGYSARYMLNIANLVTVFTPITAVAAVLICPYMHMSRADIKGSLSGMVFFIMIAVVLAAVSSFAPADIVDPIIGAAGTFTTHYVFALLLGLVVNAVLAVFFGVLAKIRRR